MRPIRLVASCALLSVLAMAAIAAEPVEKQGPQDRLFDDFDGKLALDWKQVRPDPTHQSLSKNPGKLTVTTQYGSIHVTGRPVLAKNLFLVDVPRRDEKDFVITTCLEAFQPQESWNQAGLVVYNDDDNYVKFVCEYSASATRPMLNAIAEQEGKSIVTNVMVPFELNRLWLRVVKRGSRYECSSSNDGKTFTPYADIPWGKGDAKQVGILAKNGNMPTARDVDAKFDFFEFRSATTEEKDDPAQRERLKLLGTWRADSGKVSGKPMSKPSVTNVTIEPGKFILTEGTRSVVSSYVVDSTASPKRVTVYMRSGATWTPLNWAYAVEGDRLTLCVNPKPGGEAPKSLESVDNDGLMLLNLVRAKPKTAEME